MMTDYEREKCCTGYCWEALVMESIKYEAIGSKGEQELRGMGCWNLHHI